MIKQPKKKSEENKSGSKIYCTKLALEDTAKNYGEWRN